MMMIKSLSKSLFTLLLALLFPMGLSAQSATLYGASAPDDAAFVRLFSGEVDTPEVWVGSVQFPALAAGESTAYRPVNPGVHGVFLGNSFAELIAREGHYYTVILGKASPSVHEDPRHSRADLAQIILYNYSSSETLELRSADGSIRVIPPVAAGESKAVAVNPVAVELAIFSDSKKALQIGDIGLGRGQSHAVFTVMLEGALSVFVYQAEVQNR